MSRLPLQGIRVVDLSRVFAMPYVGAYLADLGAEVIKIDTHYSQFVDTTRTLNGPYPDNVPGERYWDQAGTFQTLNRGKRSVTLDLRSERGLEILRKLISISDLVLENFTPHVTRRFGLEYSRLKSINPGLIMVSNTGYGHSGPWSDFGAMASALEPTHGTGAFTAYLERDGAGRLHSSSVPNKIGNSYTDFLASWTAQLAIMAALIHRISTGNGIWIDLAMYQVGVSFIGEGILDYAFNGRRHRSLGNRHEYLSPHGCYPCRGEDEWVVLAVRGDSEWQTFCAILGKPDLVRHPQFADPVIRYQHQDELDAIITRWTSSRDQYEVMEQLQAGGVPAGPVLNAKSLLADPHLRARGFFESVEHSPETGLGRREYLSRGWRLSAADIRIRKAAPALGEDNEYVLNQLLGMTELEIQQLYQAKVVGQTLEPAQVPSAVPLDRQVELGWIVDHDPDYDSQ